MNYQEATEAILDILAQVPDEALPEGRTEHSADGTVVLWFGGHGRHLGSARRGGTRDPGVYRDDAAREALELEATYRADLAHQTDVEIRRQP